MQSFSIYFKHKNLNFFIYSFFKMYATILHNMKKINDFLN